MSIKHMLKHIYFLQAKQKRGKKEKQKRQQKVRV